MKQYITCFGSNRYSGRNQAYQAVDIFGLNLDPFRQLTYIFDSNLTSLRLEQFFLLIIINMYVLEHWLPNHKSHL